MIWSEESALRQPRTGRVERVMCLGDFSKYALSASAGAGARLSPARTHRCSRAERGMGSNHDIFTDRVCTAASWRGGKWQRGVDGTEGVRSAKSRPWSGRRATAACRTACDQHAMRSGCVRVVIHVKHVMLCELCDGSSKS